MDEILKNFINENLDLINQNTKESWEKIYNKVNNSTLKGEFTKTLLSASIDPAEILNYIPNYYLYGSSIANYKIPDDVTSIGNYAFYNCERLMSMVIPDSVISIADYAFKYCTRLTNVTIGNSVTSIGDYAFFNCTSLTSVEIGNGVTNIGDWAFYYCTNLKEIKFKGTKKEAINCGIGDSSHKKWKENSAIEKIICTDGVIEL